MTRGDAGAAWPAPAKLNLFLHVVGRRADGFHELQTGFQFLDWCDELEFEPLSAGRLERAGETPVPESGDLALAAARLLRERARGPGGVRVRMRKRLPVGGGLGGGSSDAATTLVALNHLWGLGLPDDELAGLGLELGADVPVFVRGRAAFAEGIGERLTFADPPEPWYLVIDPGVRVATAEIFRAPELTRNTPRTTISCFVSGGGHNDCEPVVRARYPAVDEAMRWLSVRAPARLTGTGGCVFAALESRGEAEALARETPAPWRARVARGCNRSPLLARLALER